MCLCDTPVCTPVLASTHSLTLPLTRAGVKLSLAQLLKRHFSPLYTKESAKMMMATSPCATWEHCCNDLLHETKGPLCPISWLPKQPSGVGLTHEMPAIKCVDRAPGYYRSLSMCVGGFQTVLAPCEVLVKRSIAGGEGLGGEQAFPTHILPTVERSNKRLLRKPRVA